MPAQTSPYYMLMAICCCMAVASAFSPSSSSRAYFSSKQTLQRQAFRSSSPQLLRRLKGTTFLLSSKEEEIAKLEEQLKKLKEEAQAEDANDEQRQLQESDEATPTTGLSSADYVGRGPAKRPVTPMEEMVTEAWKAEQVAAEEEQEEGGGILPKIVGSIAVVLFLAIFSQAPMGQEDLSKYQGVKGPTTQIDLGDLNPTRANDN